MLLKYYFSRYKHWSQLSVPKLHRKPYLKKKLFLSKIPLGKMKYEFIDVSVLNNSLTYLTS